MKFNGTIFSKPQQDQLKEIIGKEVEAVVEKVNDVDARMLNYTGDWVANNEYHENDVVTWANDGHLYEVIKAHTSSSTITPSNTEYYKAMTESKSIEFSFANTLSLTAPALNAVKNALTKGKSAILSITVSPLNFKVPLAMSNTILSGYYVQVSPTENKTEEYFFRWAQGNSMKVTKRTTIYSAPIETSYETINVATSAATIIVGA